MTKARTDGLPAGRQGTAWWWAVCAVLVAASVAVVAIAPKDARGLVAGVAATAAVLLLGALAWARHQSARAEAARARLAGTEGWTDRLAGTELPAMVQRLRRGEPIDAAVAAVTPPPDGAGTGHLAVVRALAEAVAREENLRATATTAFVSVARRLQVMTNQQLKALEAMESRHADPEVLGDLLQLDHGTALTGRMADSIAILGGARSGRQWMQPVLLTSVVRGAMSRITGYQRVRLHGVDHVAVTGRGVEALIHVLAELLDNATQFSPPHTEVHLTGAHVQTGVAIEIEDGGLGMSAEALRRAEEMVSGATPADLVMMGEAPRLGLAVVGRLAARHGFTVSFRPSSYGGTRVVVLVPQELIAPAPDKGAEPAAGRDRPSLPRGAGAGAARTRAADGRGAESARAADEHGRSAAPSESSRARPAGSLPQRRRRTGKPASEAAAPMTKKGAPESAPERTAEEAGAWLASFQRGVDQAREAREARETTAPTSPVKDDPQ